MKVVRTIAEIRAETGAWKEQGGKIGLVPTMGYFHEGHLSLMRCARERCERVVTTLFVNPTQFGPNEDLDKYPRAFERDRDLAEKERVDILFCPDTIEMYGENYQTMVRVGKLSAGLCGADRPGHFDGVATVVTKLFNIVTPDVAVFGCKDFQQLALVRRLVRDLNFDIEIIGHPIVREPDGLAMSSRNKYLEGEDRKIATCLYRALQEAGRMYKENQDTLAAAELEEMARRIIEENGICRTEYASVVDQYTLEPMTRVDDNSVLALAMKVGSRVRLIDNCRIADMV